MISIYYSFPSFLALVTFTLGQQYCRSGPTTTVDSNLGPIRLVGNSKLIQEDSTCPGFIGPQDLTFLEADLSINGDYQLTVNIITCGNIFPTLTGAWIDYDRDFTFESWEQLSFFTTDKNTSNIFFTVPSSSLVQSGPTRLRVQVQETQADTINPCASFAYGATKDFTVIVGPRDDDPSSANWVIPVGIFWAIVAFLGLLLFCCCYKYCHKKHDNEDINTRYYRAMTSSTYSYTAPVTPSSCYQCHGSRIVLLNCESCSGVGYVQATVSFQTRQALEAASMRVECPSCAGKGHTAVNCPACC